MSKLNLTKGIGSLLRGDDLSPEENTKGKNIMSLLRDEDPAPALPEITLAAFPHLNDTETDIKQITGDENVQPILPYQQASKEFITELGLKVVKIVYRIPYNIIEVRAGFNVRYDYGDIEELGNSIWDEGQSDPLTIDLLNVNGKAKGILIDGHRRDVAIKWLASQGKIVEYVDCFITGKETTEVDRIKLMYTSQNNKQLEPLEAATIALRLHEAKVSKEAIGAMAGKSHTWAREMILLAKESPEIQELIKQKEVLYTAVIELIRIEPDAEKRKKIIFESLEQTGSFTTTDVRTRKAQKSTKTKELDPYMEETAKSIIGAELWKFGNIIQEIKKGDGSATEIKRKISILQEQPGNPISVFAKLELFKNHLSLFYSQDLQEKFKIVTQFLYGEIAEEDLLKIIEGAQVEEGEIE